MNRPMYRLAAASCARKGIYRKCGTDTEKGDHRKCKRIRAQVTYDAFTEGTTGRISRSLPPNSMTTCRSTPDPGHGREPGGSSSRTVAV
jgi:hypothetical protein